MKKLMMGLAALGTLSLVAPAFAEEAPAPAAGEKPAAKKEHKGHKGHKKAEEKKDAPKAETPAPAPAPAPAK